MHTGAAGEQQRRPRRRLWQARANAIGCARVFYLQPYNCLADDEIFLKLSLAPSFDLTYARKGIALVRGCSGSVRYSILIRVEAFRCLNCSQATFALVCTSSNFELLGDWYFYFSYTLLQVRFSAPWSASYCPAICPTETFQL